MSKDKIVAAVVAAGVLAMAWDLYNKRNQLDNLRNRYDALLRAAGDRGAGFEVR